MRRTRRRKRDAALPGRARGERERACGKEEDGGRGGRQPRQSEQSPAEEADAADERRLWRRRALFETFTTANTLPVKEFFFPSQNKEKY